ncbi:MAG: hypothetical protein ABI863_19375 [Ginsengibacter sp.]
MHKIFLIFFLVPISDNLSAQSDSASFFSLHYNIDSLRKMYGEKKHMLKKYELQTLIALSYYPELLNEHIRFEYTDINSTAQTTVTFGSIFKKINKQYIIFINDDIKRTGILLSDAPFDAQVAVLGHELAHVTDFKTRSFFDMVWWGISYLVVKQRTRIEMRTDQSTILHGLGWPLYNWADFVLNHSRANKRYKRVKETKYMQPYEILEYISKLKLQ